MPPLRVVIVDDERIARLGLREMLKSDPDIITVGECRTGTEAVRFLTDNPVDVVLLDIQMPGLDGFDVLEAMREDRPWAVIFTTAHDMHAIRAFDAAAVDYVLKPVDEKRLHLAITRARRRLEEGRLSRASHQFLATITAGPNTIRDTPIVSTKRESSRIRVRSGSRVWYIDPGDIEWIEADDYYASLQTGGRSQLVRKTLTELEADLDPSRFVRVHRSVIVNLAYVREIRTDASGRHMVAMIGGRRFPLARSRKEYLHRMLGRMPDTSHVLRRASSDRAV